MSGSEAVFDADVAETHISVLVFIGDRVWKLRKPVQFSFLDFSSPALRRRACEREVALNRRFAPDVYLGVGEVLGEDGRPEPFTIMRRMPPERRLSELVIQGSAEVGGLVSEVARLLADVHEVAPRGPRIDQAVTAESLRRVWDEGTAELERFGGEVFDAALLDRVTERYRAFLASRDELFEQRRAAGAVCEGHGDLQAEDIFCVEGGPRVLDCIEFDDRLRWGDVLADVGFLAMDLERLGAGEAAGRFVEAYERVSPLPGHPPLLSHHIAARAHVRAKVACLRYEQLVRSSSETPSPESDELAERAQLLLQVADGHLAAAEPRLVLVGGSPGTGKTTLARELSRVTGWPLLRSDEIRKELLGIDPGAPAHRDVTIDTGIYSVDHTDRTYSEVLARARDHLALGWPVILDASWTRAAHRDWASQLAHEMNSRLVELCCTCPPDLARERVSARLAEGRDASDATVEVADVLADRAEPWTSAVEVDTSVSVVEAGASALAVVGPVPGANPIRPGSGQ